jgi:hypothetical protein
VTPSKDWIYITLTCYVEIENFVQPACITKDLSLVFYARDARVTNLPRSLKSLIYGGGSKPSDSNKVAINIKPTQKKAWVWIVGESVGNLEKASLKYKK